MIDTMSPDATQSLAVELRLLVDTGRPDEALAKVEQLTDAELREAPEIEIEMARAFARTGRFERATARATTALWSARVRRDLRSQMRANLVLGGIAFEQGHPRAAEHHYGLVRVLATSLGDRQIQQKVTNNLSLLALQRQDFEAAEALLQAALRLAEELADIRAQAEVLHNLNITNRNLGQFELGARAGQRAAQLAEHMNDWSMVAMALGGLAETSLWIGASDDLDPLIDRAIDSARRANDPVREANAGRIRAVLSLKRKQLTAAYEQADAARQIALNHQADLLAAECTAIMAVAKKRAHGESAATALQQDAASQLDRHQAFLEMEWFEREWAAPV